MKDFQDLLALALVGTSRGTLPSHAGTALSDTLNAVQGDPESTLLSRAALAGLVQFAGQRAQPLTQNLPAPASTETRPQAPGRVTRHLSALVGTPHLSEWLHLCAQTGWRVPPEYLPALLDLARHDTTLRETLRPVLGERGAWLAQFNPEWRFFKGYSTPVSFSEETWLEAGEAQKESMYRDLRGSDMNASREFLTQQFKTEKAGVRKRLLSVLQATWAADDAALEPLLEDTLTDRSSDVQELARALLQHIPHSAYNTRMAGRAARMLTPEKQGLIGKLTGKQKFTLHLPETTDPDVRRDGLPTPDKDTQHPAHQRLRALLQGTHTHTLLNALNIPPTELVSLAAQVGGLTELVHAATRAEHREVARALLTQPDVQKDKYTRVALQLIAQPEQITGEISHATKQGDLQTLEVLLPHLPAPWPAEISHDLLNMLRHKATQVTNYRSWDDTVSRLLTEITRHANPHTPRPEPLPTDEENLDYYAASARQSFNSALTGLEQRQQLWQDFKEARA